MNKIVNATDTLIPAPKDGQDGKPGQPGKPGTDGKPGPAGPMLYPAGRFEDVHAPYTRTALTAPFVEYEKQFYVLNKEGTFSGINPAEDYAAHGKHATWVLMDKIKYAFIEALVADYGKIASAVFWREFMFSQFGVDADGNPVETPDGFEGFGQTDSNGRRKFVPNIIVDWLTGHFTARKATIKGNIYTPLTVITRDNWSNYLDVIKDGTFAYINWEKAGLNIQIDYWPDLNDRPGSVVQGDILHYPVTEEFLGCEANVLVTDIDFGQTHIGFSSMRYRPDRDDYIEYVNWGLKRGYYRFKLVDFSNVRTDIAPDKRYKWILTDFQSLDNDKVGV